jgi:predicted AlkP superfamily pyrophosphatase or phosphodiesterase
VANAANPPRLVVLVCVDQFRQEYLTRFHANFAETGFFRLAEKSGASYSECRHPHAYTYTGPGHASLMTGCSPNANGIIANLWLDRASNKMVNCVDDPDVRPIGCQSQDRRSARNLLTETVGDRLKAATSGKAKVLALAIKDRSSILMAGHKANAAFWMDEGCWVTSSAYLQALPRYLQILNDEKKLDQFAGQTWNLLLPAPKYVNNGPDKNDWEDPPEGLDSDFPHEMGESRGEKASDLFEHVYDSPFGNDYTLLAAREMIHNEQLGTDAVPDILCIGLSSNDAVGHHFGPDSYEVEDMTYRTDLQLGDFCRFLDQELGIGKWTLIFTSDHGVAPIPDVAEKQGKEVRSDPLPPDKLRDELEKELCSQFDVEASDSLRFLLRAEDYQIYLNYGHPELSGDNVKRARQIARDWIAKQPHVAVAMSVEDLTSKNTEPLKLALQKSFCAGRSGDVLWVLDPYCLPRESKKGTTHGSPYDYDTHVPLLLIGAGIHPGSFARAVSPSCIASTVARLLHIDPPAGNVEEPLAEVFGDKEVAGH